MVLLLLTIGYESRAEVLRHLDLATICLRFLGAVSKYRSLLPYCGLLHWPRGRAHRRVPVRFLSVPGCPSVRWLDSPTIDPTQGTVNSTVRLLFVQFRTIGWILDSHVHSRFLPNISQAPVDDSTRQAFAATMMETPDVLPSTFPSARTEKPPPTARPKVALTGAGSKRRSKSTPPAPVAPTRKNLRRSCKDRSTTKQGP